MATLGPHSVPVSEDLTLPVPAQQSSHAEQHSSDNNLVATKTQPLQVQPGHHTATLAYCPLSPFLPSGEGHTGLLLMGPVPGTY